MKALRILFTSSLALAAIAGSAASAAADDEATVSILHGVPGAVVDVYANGEALLTGFEPGTLTDPQALPAGTYDLKVVAAGAGADGEAVIEANGVTVPADANITVVAHLGADGAPVLTPFVNDVSPSDEGARLTVRHVAAAPAVDVRAGGEVVVDSLTNPNEASLDLAAGTISADIVAAGTDTVVLGPADLTLKDHTHSVVYAWGSLQDDNLGLAVQEISIAPRGGLPSTGADGAAQSATPMAIALGSLVLAGSVAAISLGRTARARARATS